MHVLFRDRDQVVLANDGALPTYCFDGNVIPASVASGQMPGAARIGIKYAVLLDGRIRSLLERDIDPVQFEKDNHNQLLAIYVLIALRFLLERFPAMTRFRYSAGAGREVGAEKVPVIATFHQDEQRGWRLFVPCSSRRCACSALARILGLVWSDLKSLGARCEGVGVGREGTRRL